jgi:hypothetical protein
MRFKTILLLILTIFAYTCILAVQASEPSDNEQKKNTDLNVNNQTGKENTSKESQKSPDKPTQETTDKTSTQPSGNTQKNPERKIIAYYFYGNVRCASCKKIEAYSYEAIQSAFKDEIKNGLLEWKTVNIDKPENKHFIDDYELYTRSLVIVEFKDQKQTKWKNLDMVWELLKNKNAFIEYVQKEIKEFLKEETK